MKDLHVLYRMFDREDVLLYVGLTNNPKRRIRTHGHQKDWWSEVCNITVQTFGSREALARAEYHAIKTEAPRYNVALNSPPRVPEQVAPDPKCPTCGSPDPARMPLEEWELLHEDGKYRPFCTNPFHFPDAPEKARLVHNNAPLLKQTQLLRLSAVAKERLELHRAALDRAFPSELFNPNLRNEAS